MTEDALKHQPPPRPIACAAGCQWCCYVKVSVTAAEVLRIVEYARANFSDSERETMRERVRAADQVTRGMGFLERGSIQLACPLLVDGRCSVYPVRPLPCIGHNSFDADECRRGYEDTAPDKDHDIELYAPQHAIADAANTGLGVGLGEAGLDGTPLELTAALRIALDRENAPDRYAQGRHVFTPARDEEGLRQLPAGALELLRGQSRGR
ncbi:MULTISPECIES: YkgJ family cysteine cluster protein [Sorangium]|uniref:YkgJ family cysteine cluster protein n=1 Tax=Sorangium TaxID=39643 RepID=UPI003D9C01A4